jgi:DUF4097 and DUF4098 domain-containing protein YvlB
VKPKREHDHEHDEPCGPGERGFAGFLRGLLSGIPWSDRAVREEVVSIDAPAGGGLRIHNSNGRTRISGEDRADIEVTAYKTARAGSQRAAEELLDEMELVFTESVEGLDLEIEIPRRRHRRGAANLCIKVPRGMRISVHAVNGRVDVDGIQGDVEVKSSNGSATITEVTGDVQVATSNAKVHCCRNRGRLRARSSNGKIEIEGHRGAVDASTSNGVIRAQIDHLGKEGIHLATSNGRIVLELPDPVDADVDIRVDNGLIRNDRPLSPGSKEAQGRVAGQLGHGGPLIKLRTSNGMVSMH